MVHVVDEETKLALADGEELEVSLSKAGQYAYFWYAAAADAASVEVAVTALEGDPDLYVSVNSSWGEAGWPTRDAWTWRSTEPASESIIIHTDDATACVPCVYRISVYAWTNDVRFTISATSTQGVRRLLDGMPASAGVDGTSTRYFRYYMSSAARVSATAWWSGGDSHSPFSGGLSRKSSSSISGRTAPPARLGRTTCT